MPLRSQTKTMRNRVAAIIQANRNALIKRNREILKAEKEAKKIEKEAKKQQKILKEKRAQLEKEKRQLKKKANAALPKRVTRSQKKN